MYEYSYTNGNRNILLLVQLILYKWQIYLIINYGKSEFDGIVSRRDKLQALNINQLKLEVNDTYKKDEKITTKFEPTDESDVINKAYLDEKIKKIDGHISYIEKHYNEFKKQYNKQTVEDILIQRKICENNDTNTLR